MNQKLLPMGHTRHFLMPDGQSSCCGSEGRRIGRELSCTCCGRKIYHIDTHPKYAISFTDLKGIFVNETYGKRVRQAHYKSKYFVSKKHGKIVRIEVLNSFTYNWETGRLYSIQITRPGKKIIRDITYKTPTYMIENEFVKKVIQLRALYLLPEFDIIRDIEQSMGIKDLLQHVKDMDVHMGGIEQAQKLNHIFYCLAYPKFTWLPCPIHTAPTPRFRKALKEADKQKDLYKAFFHGNVGKSTIEFLNDPLLGKTEHGWWAVRFLSMFLNKDKIWGLINSGWIINIMENEKSYHDDTPERDIGPKAVREFMDEYGIDRFINHVDSTIPYSSNSVIFNENNNAAAIKMYIRDSISMWKEIKKQTPDWQLPRGRSLKETHDNIMRDNRKLSVKNEDIKYTKQEKGFASQYGNLEFLLPADVHSIIDSGDYMHICVGSSGYTREAVEKKITIMFGMTEDLPAVCMEIRSKELRQAKLMYNALARDNYDICSAIKRFCEDNNIDYSQCYDLQSNEEIKYLTPQPAVPNNLFANPAEDWLDEINF